MIPKALATIAFFRLAGALLFLVPTAWGAARAADEPALFILDNDFLGPGGSDIQSTIPLLANPNARVLGFTVVTGDAWRDEEVLHLRRFLELAGHAGIPVLPGAEMPLIRTQGEMRLWEARYGKIPWKGAWNSRAGRPDHPDDPRLIPSLPEGMPAELASGDEDAVAFMIRMVKTYPHRVTIIAAGPMTNIALAVRQFPDFARLARQLVFMGALVDSNLGQVVGNADFNSDFNLLFDPEAAHIVLTAPWERVTAIGKVSNDTAMTAEIRDRLTGMPGPVAAYVARFAHVGMPFWDEIATAVALDPTLVTRDLPVRMDVDILPGPDYGRVHVWAEALTPNQGEREVHIADAIDVPRFIEGYLQDIAAISK